MSTQSQNRLSASSLALLAVAFVFAVIVSNQLLKGLRFDLTENRLYTLSAGTERMLRNIDEPINLYFYFSDQATEGIPSLRDYADRVREMLEEFEDTNRNKLRLSVIDPLPFSEDEDRAARFGLQGVQLGLAPDSIYMGLAGTNSVGDEEIIAFFQPDKEAFLEYDIAKLVSTLANPERAAVGLVSGVPMTGRFDPQTQRMEPSWMVYQQAQQLFEIRDLGSSFDKVPEDLGLLWIVQPKNLSNATQYAIDQFVMRGGKVLIFVDPVAAVDAMPTEGMPQGMPPLGQGSDLPALFAGWGIEFTSQQVVADAQLALPVNTGLGGRPTRHYGYLGVPSANMNDSDIVTAELSTINLAMAGGLKLAEESAANLEPLLMSSMSSSLIPASRFSFLPNPASLQDGFVPGHEPFVMAARISGTLPSAFPDGFPEPPSAGDNDETEHLAESTEPANLIVVTDVDMLSDSLWVRVQRFFGQQVASAFASNGAFVANAIESLAGSADLIGVRSRGSFARPFTKVDELRVAAEARFRETEQRLQSELAETERRLGELQSSREDTGGLLPTDEQQAEIDRFIDQRASIRKDLRAVQRGLDQDIENLGRTLKIINIGLVPLLLTLTTLFVLWRRRRKESL
ncbi:MAG: Gldg family protein [Gammaproteobacteria bacterium]|nr:Gldg family protein [Gammaproteobacteria bacterium]MDH3409020.1 Gldg family protein [Gammaproteobacteria bacterium]